MLGKGLTKLEGLEMTRLCYALFHEIKLNFQLTCMDF